MAYIKLTRLFLTICFLTGLSSCYSIGAEITKDSNASEASGRKVRIVLVGDSTVTDKQGWGAGFSRFLTDRAECINKARGGRSSKSYINEGLWTEDGRGTRA